MTTKTVSWDGADTSRRSSANGLLKHSINAPVTANLTDDRPLGTNAASTDNLSGRRAARLS
jgi:hypothetical protein